ncbi:MAG: winged helix-turn-helix transcriptional regulator [Candidatus Bathyarchaeota archaeon]|nr:MAG: winged helix-turn-helix transcriptional regulator [Candidatus Bathyarchaeota archaeon]
MKEKEWKVLIELMKNSRQSDRQMAKIIGVSQPTVTRVRTRLERDGIIKEYTAIPDFLKLGYELMAITLIKLKKGLSAEQIKKAQELSYELAKKSPATGPLEVIMAERGEGIGYNGVFITYHRSYTSYSRFVRWLTRFEFFDVSAVDSFMIALGDRIRYFPLSLSNIARHLQQNQNRF